MITTPENRFDPCSIFISLSLKCLHKYLLRTQIMLKNAENKFNISSRRIWNVEHTFVWMWKAKKKKK